MEDLALAGLRGNQVPEVAYLRLADAMDAPEALLQAVRIPGQVIVDHQVSALQVDTLARGIRCHQHLHEFLLSKGSLRLRPLLSAYPAMNRDHSFISSEHGAYALRQVVERI